MIPPQLQDENFRFVLLKTKSKVPYEPEWQHKGYEFDNPKLIEHIKNGGNYGVIGGKGNLRVLDVDNKEYIKKLHINTFTVKTGTGGLHFYFISDYNINHVLTNGIGELRGNNYQVVGAGSIHPNGNKYEVNSDITIAELSEKQVLELLKPYIRQDSTEQTKSEVSDKRDTSRSAKEYWEVTKLIRNAFSKEEVFKRMSVYAKWSSAPPQYRELTYKNALVYVNKKDEEKEEKEREIKESGDLQKQVFFYLAKSGTEGTRQATEIIVKEILKIEKIYTIRDDVKTEIWIYKDGIYVPQGITYIKNAVRYILENLYTNQLANEVVAKISVDTYIDSNDFFKEEDIKKVVLQNGILDLEKKEIEPFSSKYTFFNKLPITFDKTKECVAVKTHFESILPNKEDIKVIQELFGYLLLRDQSYEKAFMFTGSGRNGKGKTLSLMKRFLGIENVSNIPLQQLDNDLFSVAELHNKTANLGGDISKTALKETGMFKSLVGRDLISAARKFMTRVGFVSYAKMIFCANELPITYDLTIAFFNRWIILDFPYTFLIGEEYEESKNDKNIKLADKDIILKLTTEEELSGLLNWALEGLHRLQKNTSFSYSATTNQVKTLWLRKSNSFHAFCLDSIKESYEGKITKDELRRGYYIYCKKYKLVPTTDKAILTILATTYGVSEHRTNIDNTQVRYWLGIKFNEKSQGSQVSHGFSPYRGQNEKGMGGNMVDGLTTLTQTEYFKCGFCSKYSYINQKLNGNLICKECVDLEKNI